MGQEALVKGEEAFGADRLGETVKGSLVEISVLVVHARHDGVWNKPQVSRQNVGDGRNRAKLTRGMHKAANDEPTHGTTGEVQSGTLLHAEMLDKTSLGEKVGGKLDRAAEAGADHGGADTTVKAAEALGAVDLVEAMPGAAVLVLGTDGAEGREALEACLDKEEGTAGRGADYARSSTAEHVDAEVLCGAVLE